MLGVIVPAHNEEALLAPCLAALITASRHEDLAAEPVRIMVVLDACDDFSGAIARAYGVETLSLDARNVGIARATGADWLLAHGARWLAFTDADSRVSARWLTSQLALNADAVCGSIAVDDWSEHPESVREHFQKTYTDADGHRHIHGANLGVSAHAYLRAGGFPPLTCSEDVALVDRLIAIGAHIAWSAAPRVITSARTAARARGGFGDTLVAMAAV
ncbi:glycosyltransferase (plasmid) [Paraburkholderia sp. D15]|uniref:glycosyltransferase n=1 Tax=Paraburkholderia sp. D15 TaxID=2880218 RepID=UPI00247A4F92|nr:glycosyltransferase [Paraburkholderia sp. D15]WGS54994.1 glycosyltransferase [Paraburkholderia sp. D15]